MVLRIVRQVPSGSIDICRPGVQTGRLKISATEFKAKCLALTDQVHESGKPVLITKRGRVVASLIAQEDLDHKPWLQVRGTVRWQGDPLKPVVEEEEIEALSDRSTPP